MSISLPFRWPFRRSTPSPPPSSVEHTSADDGSSTLPGWVKDLGEDFAVKGWRWIIAKAKSQIRRSRSLEPIYFREEFSPNAVQQEDFSLFPTQEDGAKRTAKEVAEALSLGFTARSMLYGIAKMDPNKGHGDIFLHLLTYYGGVKAAFDLLKDWNDKDRKEIAYLLYFDGRTDIPRVRLFLMEFVEKDIPMVERATLILAQSSEWRGVTNKILSELPMLKRNASILLESSSILDFSPTLLALTFPIEELEQHLIRHYKKAVLSGILYTRAVEEYFEGMEEVKAERGELMAKLSKLKRERLALRGKDKREEKIAEKEKKIREGLAELEEREGKLRKEAMEAYATMVEMWEEFLEQGRGAFDIGRPESFDTSQVADWLYRLMLEQPFLYFALFLRPLSYVKRGGAALTIALAPLRALLSHYYTVGHAQVEKVFVHLIRKFRSSTPLLDKMLATAGVDVSYREKHTIFLPLFEYPGSHYEMVNAIGKMLSYLRRPSPFKWEAIQDELEAFREILSSYLGMLGIGSASLHSLKDVRHLLSIPFSPRVDVALSDSIDDLYDNLTLVRSKIVEEVKALREIEAIRVPFWDSNRKYIKALLVLEKKINIALLRAYERAIANHHREMFNSKRERLMEVKDEFIESVVGDPIV